MLHINMFMPIVNAFEEIPECLISSEHGHCSLVFVLYNHFVDCIEVLKLINVELLVLCHLHLILYIVGLILNI